MEPASASRTQASSAVFDFLSIADRGPSLRIDVTLSLKNRDGGSLARAVKFHV